MNDNPHATLQEFRVAAFEFRTRGVSKSDAVKDRPEASKPGTLKLELPDSG